MRRRDVTAVCLLVFALVACSGAPPQSAAPGQPASLPPAATLTPSESRAPTEATPAAPGSLQPGDTAPPAGADYDLAYGPPQPVDVQPTLSDITFTGSVTVENGGFLTLVGPDGTFYQLDVPPDAVIEDLDITMTAVSSIAGSPLGDRLVGAVKLEPEGLIFVQPATLTIIPASPIAVAEEGPFAADGDGANFHLYPLDVDPSAIKMHLLHFSIFGLFQTDAERRAQMILKTARDVADQVMQEIEAEVAKAREAGTNLDFEATGQKLTYYRDRVLRPMLALAENDHTLFREAYKRWIKWEKYRQLVVGTADVDPELEASLIRAFRNYVDHHIERCYEHELGAIVDVLAMIRIDQLLSSPLGLDIAEVQELMDKCLRFTLEMDSTMEASLNTCALIDAGQSSVDEMARVTTAVPILLNRQEMRPWHAPMLWQEASLEAECHLLSGEGGDFFRCNMTFAGFGEGDEFSVVSVFPEFSSFYRRPEEEETRTRVWIKSIWVQPGDPQIFSDGDCTLLETWNDSDTSRISGGWLAGWKDNSAPVGRQMVQNETYGEIYVLTGWRPSEDIEIVATREYVGGTDSLFGTTNEETTFILRHTPER